MPQKLPATECIEVVRDREVPKTVERRKVPLDIGGICKAIDRIYRSGKPQPKAQPPDRAPSSSSPPRSGKSGS